MLERLSAVPNQIAGDKAFGELTREDYENVLEPQLDGARREGHALRLLCQVGPEFDGFTPDVAWEDAKRGLPSLRSFAACAVVSDRDRIRHWARITGRFLRHAVHVFANRDRGKAIVWRDSRPQEVGGVIVISKEALQAQDGVGDCAGADRRGEPPIPREQVRQRGGTRLRLATMPRTIASGLMLCALSLLLPRASAAEIEGLPHGASSVAGAPVGHGIFTVTRVDVATKTLVLHEPQIGTLAMRAGPGVSLGAVKAGQQVQVAYYREVALALDVLDGSRGPHSRVRPDGVTARQPTVTEKVVAVDTLGHNVTVRAFSGATHVVHVTDPGLQAQLEAVRSGERLELTYAEAEAVSVVAVR